MRFLVGAGGLNNVLGIVGKIAGMWSDICNVFGTRQVSYKNNFNKTRI